MKANIYCLVLLFLALITGSCTDKCSECSDDYSLRFVFENPDGEEILTDLSQVTIEDLQNNTYTIEVEETETDTVFITNLGNLIASEELRDTIVFKYNNALVDSAVVNSGFKRDSDCCSNPRIVESIDALNLTGIRLIRPNYFIYKIVITP